MSRMVSGIRVSPASIELAAPVKRPDTCASPPAKLSRVGCNRQPPVPDPDPESLSATITAGVSKRSGRRSSVPCALMVIRPGATWPRN